MVIAGSVAIVMLCAIMLRVVAESSRRKAIWELTEETIKLQKTDESDKEAEAGQDAGQTAEQVNIMIEQIRALRTGAFAPYSQQPLLRTFLLPLGSFGGAALIEYLTLSNL